ncbi:hypothetical protein LSH36_1154g00094 [Paralvinella palmiformis]|uniref:Fucosyltransferase n=1 Tax=Paralvinella palmiformis TaxID=53620 RepID=A0AAD9MPF6_9ANNE|nr:hypothetical protein LSH36_1154g00094 [Paralvinella palmiformis]
MTPKWSLQSTKTNFGLLICVIIVMVCVFAQLTIWWELRRPPEGLWRNSSLPTFSDERVPGRNSTKIIMFWTRRANTNNWFSYPEKFTTRSMSKITNCSQNNCIYTSNHSLIRQADILLFYLNEKPDWPKVRYAHQYYAHFIHEAPGKRNQRTFLDQYEDNINITINFRRDADLYLPYNTLLPVKSDHDYRPRIPHGNKTGMAVWPVSHCVTESHREHYVAELSKHLEVDIYGRCGSHICNRSRTHSCSKSWEEKYKYYLSFENNVCEDYITEKVFLPLQYEIIPVVFGGGNYSRDVPPRSVINARDFDSPKDLANFLIHLASDEQRYRSYFKWKSRFEIVGGVPRFMCRLCQALHENEFHPHPAKSHYADYWYGVHGEMCDNEVIPRMRKEGGW